MAFANTLTKEEYFDKRAERIGASAIVRTGLYEANIQQNSHESGVFAVKEVVQITDIDQDGEDFRLTMHSHTSGATIMGRVTLNGIVYEGNAPEKGYLVEPPMEDIDFELEEMCGEFLEAIPLYNKAPDLQQPVKHLEAPLP